MWRQMARRRGLAMHFKQTPFFEATVSALDAFWRNTHIVMHYQ
ncbi:hypothetical protein SAMCFNEI73_pB0214 (plasmid) [Sinorhizobium americanum]|uniref:Uncharacterized protein n=1 Tax=Sinorhizobium americanum TaxID=194963 RepID=A0A1L3LTI6_9HYPH|nr:hypothetical protein SAMCFNEI73_pB0214 [Sinorhizobium americanum]